MIIHYRPCPNPVCGDGTVQEFVYYRQPPPGAAVFERGYTPAPGSALLKVARPRPCVICGGKGEVPA